MPSLLALIDRERLFTVGDGLVWSLDSGWTIALASLGLVLAGALLHAVFKVPLAFVLRHQALSPPLVVRSRLLAWLRLIGFGAIVLGVRSCWACR